MTITRSYPLADLITLLRLPDQRLAAGADQRRSNLPSDNEARLMLGIGGTRWRRFKAEGLDPWHAEHYALATGRLPCEVWPTWYDDELAELDAEVPA